ncbi:hypothetical protein [Hydrogenophaga sp.]|uniref:hypothetical protein n=1 Tax=Hydrogenophaga sp. TaxID=1904254 RepID=UPI002FC75AC2
MWKELGTTSVLIACIVLFVAFAGRGMIEASPVYELAQLEVQKRYGVSSSDLSIKLFWPFKFSEGDISGRAEFVACDLRGDCFEVKADKRLGKWHVVDAIKK